jgi:hypothetical protein
LLSEDEQVRFTYPVYFLLITAISSASAPAQIQPDPLSDFYDNTWNVYSVTGVNYYFVNRDHTWNGVKRQFKTPAGKHPSGTWRVEGQKVCFHHVIGDPDPNDDCFDILGKKLGVPWKMDIASDQEVLGILHKGRALSSLK